MSVFNRFDINRNLLQIYNIFISRPRMFIHLVKNKHYYKAKSYYPSREHKSTFKVFLDQLRNILFYGEPNVNYFMHGFDVKGFRKFDDFTPKLRFQKKRNQLNVYPYNNSIGVLRDKMFFEIVAKSFGINTPENIGILKDGQVFSFKTKEYVDFEDFIETYPNVKLFIKIVDGLGGEGIFSVIFQNNLLYVNGEVKSINAFLAFIGTKRYIIQEAILQHERMNELYPHAVNTVRIVTVNKNQDAKLFFSFLRLGAHGINLDNMSQGGLKVDVINETGQLNSLGFYMPKFGTTTEEHPDTKIRFSDFTIPYFEEAVNQVIQFHNLLPNIHSIGWDVAITQNGPTIVEGNDNWGFSLHTDIKNQKIKFKEYFN